MLLILIAACLASYGTETVMQLCHGRRRCTISADRANFGNPCRPESRVYLKVVYTCSEYFLRLQKNPVQNVNIKTIGKISLKQFDFSTT